jgi:hypothetical protein
MARRVHLSRRYLLWLRITDFNIRNAGLGILPPIGLSLEGKMAVYEFSRSDGVLCWGHPKNAKFICLLQRYLVH